uniref:Endonuclease GajA/Old nuclease/RecF-like AAA domain-containing protein n=1 Tax=Acidianus brierleyi TaxID=41673 RepID=A0A2U9ID44_9CREN
MEIATFKGEQWSWFKATKSRGKLIISDKELVEWLYSHGSSSYLIFGTDIIPSRLWDSKSNSPLLIFDYINRGGTIIWAGDVPFLYKGSKQVTGINIFNTEILPSEVDTKNTLVGNLLEYPRNKGLRPINNISDIIPISVTSEGKPTAWILKKGNGYFIRLFDIGEVNEDYLFSFPEKFEELKKTFAIKLNVRNLEDLVLKFDKMNVIIGDNAAGKTTILEAISLFSNNNISIDGITYSRNLLQTNFDDALAMIISKNYGRTFTVEYINDMKYFIAKSRLYRVSSDIIFINSRRLTEYEKYVISNWENIFNKRKELSLLLKTIDKSFRNVLNEPFNGVQQLMIEKEDSSVIRLDDLGEGIKNLIVLILLYSIYSPKILLIDDMEAMGLYVNKLEILMNFLLKIIEQDGVKILVTTQSFDVLYSLVKAGAKVFIMGSGKIYEMNNDEAKVRIESNEDLRLISQSLEEILSEGKQ